MNDDELLQGTGLFEYVEERPRVIQTAEDVTPEVLAAADEAMAWFESEERIDWDTFWDKFDCAAFVMENTLSPAARKIERYVREQRRA